MTVEGRALRNVRRFGGKRTIKEKANLGVPRARRKVDTLKSWPASTNRHYQAGDGGRR